MCDVQHAETSLVGEHRSVPVARRFVRETLASWGVEDRFEWVATTVVSELTTNAVLHARTGFTVRLTLTDDALRIEVSDGSPRIPVPRQFDRHATTGRGLRMLGSLSPAHGIEPTPTGKTVWAELHAIPAGGGWPDEGADDDEDAGPADVDTSAVVARGDEGEPHGHEGGAHQDDRLTLGTSVRRAA